MMAFKKVLFALLMISLYLAVGDSSSSIASDDVSEMVKTESSHRHQRRSVFGVLKRQFRRKKKKEERKTQFNSNLRWENPATTENIVILTDGTNDFYLARDKDCIPSLCDTNQQTCPSSTNKVLVNPDDFEILEWKPVQKGKLPPFAVETCNGYFVAMDEKNQMGYVREKSKKQTDKKEFSIKSKNIEILTLNYDIAEEYLTNIKFNGQPVQRDKKPTMTKNIMVANHNCQPMKQQIRVDSGTEEVSSYQTGSSLLLGGSVGIKIKEVVDLGIKSELTVSETQSNSETKKADQGYTQEIEIPAITSCNLVIATSAFIATVPFTAELTRVYNETNIRTAFINGTYKYQESTEIKTNFEKCTKFPVKCP